VKGDHPGEFEELTLLAIRAIDPPAYGVPVQQFIERTTGRNVAMGAVYAALDRLEGKGLVRSTVGQSTAERGGKARRLFAVTQAGMRALRDIRAVRDRRWRASEER
jgi:DNA-binding PadR family transcriptional regulator